MENHAVHNKFVPIENVLKMSKLEQYVSHVVSFTSRYNNSTSYSYAPVNLVGRYAKYPSYGDFPEAYFLRSYGNWGKKSEGYQSNYRPQDADFFGAEDYITLEFESPVVPRDICIYEIYNPGAVVRIWCKLLNTVKPCPWVLLWEGAPQSCPHKSRKFHPKIRKINHFTKIIRLEINQSLLEYHWSIEAVLLGGLQPTTELQFNMMLKGIFNNFQCEDVPDRLVYQKDIYSLKNYNGDMFLNLPYEVVLHIFQYLDLKSLSRCAQVSKRWNMVSADPILYQNLNLKPYWYLVNGDTLQYFTERCKSLKKLDVSWCGNDVNGFSSLLKRFLKNYRQTITHLSLCNCEYINEGLMHEISNCSELVDLRLRNSGNWMLPVLHSLEKLVSLDVSGTEIKDLDLINILKANPCLEHIIIDLCEYLFYIDRIIEIVVQYNKRLVTWSSWKAISMTADGVRLFRECHNLRELDLGWCLITSDPGDCLELIANSCKQLKRLILSEWRGINDNLLMPIILQCKELNQLDLLGIKNISADICEKALLLLPKLRLLDISFCNSIHQDEVEIWRQQYPHITIQRSCQYVVTDYLN